MGKNKIYKKRTAANCFFCVIFALFFFQSNAQNSTADSLKIQKIIKEKPAESVATITDPEQVNFITNYIDARNAAKQMAAGKLEQKSNSSIGKKYANGDKSAIAEIVAILKSRDVEKINTLLKEIEPAYEEDRKPLFLDQEVKKAIFDLIANEELEHVVVQFLGFNHVEGSMSLFENRLLSGKSTDNDRIIYWLGSDGKSEKTVDYIVSLYQKNNKAFEDYTWAINGLGDFLENGSPGIRQKILDICYDYLNKNPLRKTDVKIKNDDYLGNQQNIKLAFLGMTVKYGDQRTVVFVENLEKLLLRETKPEAKKTIHLMTQTSLLRFYDTGKKKAVVIEALSEKSLYSATLPNIEAYKELSGDPEIKAAVLKQFEANATETDQIMPDVLAVFYGSNGNDFKALVRQNIKNPKLQNLLTEAFAIDNESLDDQNASLLEAGIITNPIAAADIEQYKKSNYLEDHSIYTNLQMSGSLINFDTEADTVPVEYNVLLDGFVKISKGKIQGLKSYLQTALNEKEETIAYHFLVSYHGKCFIMNPEDQSDWYDMASFQQLLDQLVAEGVFKEKFVPLATGGQDMTYIFGDEQKIQALLKKYKLNADDNYNER